MADQKLSLRDTAAPVAAVSVVGSASGAMTVTGGVVQLTAAAQTLGTYVDENRHTSAVVDYLLPQAEPLAASGSRFQMSVRCDGKANTTPPPSLRVLVRDANGILWAHNTRLQGLGTVPITAGYEQVETFPWNATELGRVTPWMQNRADGTIDAAVPPKAPLLLAGFRLILDAAQKYTVAVTGLHWLDAVREPDPYWLFTLEPNWPERTRAAGGSPRSWESPQMGSTAAARFGSGAGAPRPFVRPSDLGLTPGAHSYALEILASDGWHTVFSRQGSWKVADGQDSFLSIPLLPAGTYHLRLSVWPQESSPPQELYACYVVVRNKASSAASVKQAEAGLPLRFSSSSGTNCFAPHAPALVTIRSAGSKGTIDWTVQSSDQDTVATGSAPANGGATIDLAKYRASGAAFWITATLTEDGKVRSIVRRTLGIQSAAAAPKPAGATTLKPMASAGEITRTKCDWNEGGTPLVSQAKTLMPAFKIWMSEAKQDNYTTVELSAPWMEIEPLSGVYEWKQLDALVHQAAGLGLKVVLRIHPVYGNVPSWVPREYQEDQFGNANGLWGGSSFLVATPASVSLRQGLDRYAEALAQHFYANPTVVGYTLSNVMFDHGWLDMPYLNQYIDYSASMRRFFIDAVRTQYAGSLSRVNAAYKTHYTHWDEITAPLPEFTEDAQGRLKPDNRPVWRDWMKAKLGAMVASKEAMLGGLRRGDPHCQVGFYADDALSYTADEYVQQKCFVADGSMEMMFPPALEQYQIRYEPIGKIARTAPLVDVGMTNLLAFRPGWNTFNNYVFPDRALADFSPTELEAEKRLVQWFGVIDRLNGAQPVRASGSNDTPAAYVYSMETLFDIGQHTFGGRTQDFIKPYQFQIGAEKVHTDWVDANSLNEQSLSARPYLYLPYCADVLKAKVGKAVTAYVRGGGRLVVEPTSGYWQEGTEKPNVLLSLLGIPQIVPHPKTVQDAPAEDLYGQPLAFREKNWLPPVETQPTPWLQNIPKQYLRPYRIASLPPHAEVVSRYADGTPAAFTLPVGRGQVLVLCGVVDWLACSGLASAVDAWGRGLPPATQKPVDPSLISSEFTNHGSLYLVGRRFIGHDEISRIAQGDTSPALQVAASRACVLANAGHSAYHVRELLTGKDFGVLPGTDLNSKGISLNLKPGEGFLFEAVPTTATARQ